jgi:hypothetical protein
MTDEQWNGIREWANDQLKDKTRRSHFVEVEELMTMFQLAYPFWEDLVSRADAKDGTFSVHAATRYSRDPEHPEMENEPAGQVEFRRVLKYGRLR